MGYQTSRHNKFFQHYDIATIHTQWTQIDGALWDKFVEYQPTHPHPHQPPQPQPQPQTPNPTPHPPTRPPQLVKPVGLFGKTLYKWNTRHIVFS